MTAIALRSLATRRLRAALTSIAVLLGVAMVAGTLIETDQITSAFERITRQSVSRIDVVVTPEESFSAAFNSEPQTLDADLVRRIRAVDGVAGANGELTAFGQMIVDGEPVETFGAPPLVFSDAPDRFDPSTIVDGRDPSGPGEASILAVNAADHDISVGDTIGVATARGERQVEVVGTFEFGDGGSSLGGATGVELTREQVWSWFDLSGEYTSIGVIADEGVAPDALSDRVDAALGGDAKVQTADQSADEAAAEINDQIGSFLTPALLALAGAAVLVGAFIIFNTFSITVAQRTREFAMLRALGATRGQVLAGVAFEALLIGVAASLVGLVAGIGISKLLNSLFDAVGFGIPRTGLILEARTIAVALVVGIGTTLLAALLPALRAMRVAPIVAMAGTQARPSGRARRATQLAAAVLLLGGAALTATGLFGDGAAASRLGAMGGGAIAIFIGAALSSRYVIRPLADLIGWPIERIFRTPGRLARENAERNPGRTAVTSAALMVGIGLVVFVAVFAAGLKSSFGSQIEQLVKADVVVYGQGFQPLPRRAADRVAAVDGVAASLPLAWDQVEVNGRPSNALTDIAIGADTSTLLDVYEFEWLDGDDALVSGLGPGEVLIEEQFAAANEIAVGDTYEVETPSGGTGSLTAVGEYRDPTILQGTIVTEGTLRSISPVTDPITVLVAADPGADVATVQSEIERATSEFPTLEVQDRAEYEDAIGAQLDQIVYMLYALLAMSVVISLFGIANSLFLSIHERTGELGVLRAIGATREQIRRVIRYESVITSVIGGLLGTVIGVAFAAVVIASLSNLGLGFALPVGQLMAFMALAIVVGVVGSIGPARRASRVDVLEAIGHE
jgi:putative ABC transport system permease protein